MWDFMLTVLTIPDQVCSVYQDGETAGSANSCWNLKGRLAVSHVTNNKGFFMWSLLNTTTDDACTRRKSSSLLAMLAGGECLSEFNRYDTNREQV